MDFVQKIVHYIRGGKMEFDFRQRIFNVASFTFGACFSLIGLGNWVLGDFSTFLIASSFLTGGAYLAIFYSSRMKSLYFPWLFVAFTLAVGSAFWFMTYGWRGAMPIIISLAFIICLTVVPKNETWLTLAFLLTVIGLGVVESLFPHWVTPYPTEDSHFADVWGTLIISILFLYFAFRGLSKIYLEERKKLTEKNLELEQTQVQLVQSEKLASLGQLTAGIAHEINNPLNFVASGVAVLEMSTFQLIELVKAYEELEKHHPELFESEKADKILEIKTRMGLAETLDEIPHIIDDIENGGTRIRTIVEGLQYFSHFDNDTLVAVDLNKCIQRVLTLYDSRLRNLHLDCQLTANLPHSKGNIGQIQQVIMGLLENAVDACEEEAEISISTKVAGNEIALELRDNGRGMNGNTLSKVFDPFFTTKPVGQGTGLGLSISYGIVQQHGGRIEVESELGKGACFTVYLPIK
ncbi:MAG: signal transduction histidine kinase [Flammeovirgaceae bacterium]|jgi:signal transduction histidine kinase